MFGLFNSARGSADNLRLNAMSDGVFAIVITLMVLEVKVPRVAHAHLVAALSEMLPDIAAVLLSFVVLGIYWIGHNNVFQHVLRHDRAMLWLNILFLLVAAMIPFAANMLVHYADVPVAYVAYAGCLALGGVLLDCIWWYASRNRHLMCDTVTPELIRSFHVRILTGPVLYIAAVGVAFVSRAGAWVLFAMAILYYLLPTAQDKHHHTQLSGTQEAGKQ